MFTFEWLCLSLSPDDTILNKQTKHQALAPSGPMKLPIKSRLVRVEFCCKASARAWQETRDLRNTNTANASIHAKYIKIHQSLVITNFNWMNASGNQGCIALPFCHFPNVTFIRPCFTPSPLMTPSSPDTKPAPLQGRCCYCSNTAASEWSSV